MIIKFLSINEKLRFRNKFFYLLNFIILYIFLTFILLIICIFFSGFHDKIIMEPLT